MAEESAEYVGNCDLLFVPLSYLCQLMAPMAKARTGANHRIVELRGRHHFWVLGHSLEHPISSNRAILRATLRSVNDARTAAFISVRLDDFGI
jgi:hypothetical protein